MRDPQPRLDPLGAPAPHRVLVLDGEHAVEAALVERIHVVREVDLSQTRDPVAPPAHVPGVLLARRHAAEEPVAVALDREGLGVLRMSVGDPVHEGPQRISPVGSAQSGGDEPLRAGMILSNEPGYYKTGAYGIRIENLVLVVERPIEEAEKETLGFETLTFAPIERRLVDVSMLSEAELKWLNDYHAEVLEKISPRLEGEDKAWLERQCAPLSR